MTLTKRNRKLNVEDVCNYVRPPRIELIEDFYKKESGQRQYHHGTTMYMQEKVVLKLNHIPY